MRPPAALPLSFERLSPEESRRRALAFFEAVRTRRSVRDFSPEPVSRELIELAVRAASTAPSGANKQPWRFVAVSNPALKAEIRAGAEAEERESYDHRMGAEWLAALAPLGTDWQKPFLELAPWLVVVFAEAWEETASGERRKNYYVKESVGIACGVFIAALHEMGLVTLTHTPSPMAFLNRILARPENEKPFILFPVGYPADGAVVPDIGRKSLEDVLVWRE
jgi:iodotyrosine deiodinase